MRGRALHQATAEAALQNAKQLLRDSQVLRRRGSQGHACALSILGMEEAAKALVYKQAAEGLIRFVSRRPNNLSTYAERDLLDHKFKHGAISRLLVGAFEYRPFQATISETRKHTFTRAEVEAMFRRAHTRQWIQTTELQSGGTAARELRKIFETLHRLDRLKNAALYVGREGREIRRPDATARGDFDRVRELSTVVVRAAEEIVSRRFTADQRREFALQLHSLSAQARRLRRRSRRSRPGSPSPS